MHIERAAMYGNSTQLMYYFSDVFVGDFDNPSKQSLIVDTGSGYTCFPCEGYCTHCGKHLNSYYEIDESKTKEILNWKEKTGYRCMDHDKCEFSIRYGEGSSYYGFWVIDDVYFGSHSGRDDVQRFQFGCVTRETKYFYTQEADGIMGLATNGNRDVQPIYTHLYQKGLIEKDEFTLWLGKNGGVFFLGGYDNALKIHPDLPIQWIDLLSGSQFYIEITDVYIGDVKMKGKPSKAMIDSGTTFTYMSRNQYNEIDKITRELCNGTLKCLGEWKKNNWYKFHPSENQTVKDFFRSFPVYKFMSGDKYIKWFPSDYFYQENYDEYCLTIDPYGSENRMVIGGSMMRESMYAFDITNRRVGVARAKWSEDPDMYVYDEEQYLNCK